MRRGTLIAGLVVASMTQFPASAAPDHAVPAAKIVFLAPTEGPLAASAEEAFVGAKAAFAAHPADDFLVEIARDQPKKGKDAKAYDAWFAELDKRGVTMTCAFLPDGESAAVEKAAEKAKMPLLVLSPEATKPDLNPAHAVFWAGGLRPTEEALYAMDFLLEPLGVHAPAIFHDGSARAVEAASKCRKFHHSSQAPREPVELPADFGVADVKGLLGRNATKSSAADATSAGDGADGILYFGGPVAAERLLAACADAKIDAPVLLGQGLVSRAVPTFAAGKAKSAWALEAQYFEDYFGTEVCPKPVDAAPLAAAAKETGDHLYPATVRGWRAGRWIQAALRRAGESPEKKADKKFVWGLRNINREDARGRCVFEPWGHACLARFEAWVCGAWRDVKPCSRVNPLYLPASGMPQVGFFDPARFEWEPGTFYVWLHWGKPEERTIEMDLNKLGLDPGEAESRFRDDIVDDLMGRTISRLNRLYLRNSDGSAIPGVSFNVTFGADKEPKGLKGSHRMEMILRGDDPEAGGRAHGAWCEVFTTYIERTIYADKALTPMLGPSDRDYAYGKYRWNTSLERDLRSGFIRSLVDGYTQGFGLTGAHEAGHNYGLGHDTTIPRSIMNVVEAVGLDFEWAEWAPEHVVLLEKRLGRAAAPR